NVGTGGQVAAWVGEFVHDVALETRPFPGGGYLLVCAGLSGGRSYAVLEGFFRRVLEGLDCAAAGQPLYPAIDRLGPLAPPGSGGPWTGWRPWPRGAGAACAASRCSAAPGSGRSCAPRGRVPRRRTSRRRT